MCVCVQDIKKSILKHVACLGIDPVRKRIIKHAVFGSGDTAARAFKLSDDNKLVVVVSKKAITLSRAERRYYERAIKVKRSMRTISTAPRKSIEKSNV